MRPLIVIAGATAAGKSETAFELAKYSGSEIISADSMQIYKYLDIGAAKPSLEIRQKVVHHLVDILEPDKKFTAFDFKTRAEKAIHSLHKRNKVPIIAGGAGLYIKTLTEDFNCAVQVSPEIKDQVKNELDMVGAVKMHAELSRIDPVTAQKIQPNDKQRIERALSVYRETGKKLSEFYEAGPPQEPRFDVYYFLLQWDRQKLYDNINRRVDWMIKEGLIEETRNILGKGYDKTLKPLQGIGYNQIIQYIDGKIPLDQAVNEIKRESRNYAKRQLTWFRKAPGAISISAGPHKSAVTIRDKILSHLPKGLVAFLALIICAVTAPYADAKNFAPFTDGVRAFHAGDYPKAANRFLSIRNSNPDTLAGKRALYFLGKTYAKLDRHETAIRFFIKALGQFPQIEDYIRFNLAQVYFKLGENKHALKQINTLIEDFPETILLLEAGIFKAELLKRLGQQKQAAQFLGQIEIFIKKKAGGKFFRTWLPEIIFKQGGLYESLNDPEKALGYYRQLYIHHSTHPATDKAALKIERLARTRSLHPSALSLDEHSKRINNLLRGVRYQLAIKEITQLKSAMLDARLPAKFYFYQARAYKSLRQRQKSNEILLEFLKTYPAHPRVPEAKFLIGRNAWNLGRPELGAEFFQSVVAGHKNSKWIAKAQFLLGKVYEDIKKPEEAIKSYQALADQGGQNIYAQKGAWNIGWIYYKAAEYDKAFDQFKKTSTAFPQGIYIEKILFWMAKSAEKTKGKESARKIYQEIFHRFPFTYYGLKADEKLLGQGIKPASAILLRKGRRVKTSAQTQDIPETLSQGLTGREKFHFLRANEMAVMGFHKNATLEIGRIESSIKQDLSNALWLSTMYNRVNAYTQAFRVLSRQRDRLTKKREKEFPIEFWENYFPPAYSATIDSSARKYHVDPLLVKSVIRQESLYDTQALSSAGAMGLMQIMPKTGRKIWQRLNGSQHFDKSVLFDPETNIQMGVKYIEGLRKKYGDYYPYILICYNAGPKVLEKWLRRFKHIKDNDVFIESIPYLETRNYIKRVMRNYGIYKLLNSSNLGKP